MRRTLQRESIIWTWIKTLFYFSITLMVFPMTLICFCFVGLGHKLKLFILSKRFRYLEFARSNTVRTLMDTSRNPGILHFLVKINGSCDIERIRSAYQMHLLDKCDRNGKLMYPRLKTCLVSIWNQYAFIKSFEDFKIENHIKMGPSHFRTKPITEETIQECVSYIVSKYMAPEVPPWQIQIISVGHAYYMLIRIHHLILDEQKNLKVSDMMLLDHSKGIKVGSNLMMTDEEKKLIKSPLMDMIRKPSNIIAIYDDITDSLTQRWNDFVYKHDSLDHHDGFAKKPIDMSSLVSSLIMMMLNTYLDYKHQNGKALQNTTDPQMRFRFWMNLMKKEWERRQLSFSLIFDIFLQTINPFNVISNIIKFIWWTFITWSLLSPFYIWRELEALRNFVFLYKDVPTNSVIGFLVTYVPLVIGSIKEFLYFSGIILNGPRLFIEEIFNDDHRDEPHGLQNVTLCGRKVVSWSDPIPIDDLKLKSIRNHRTLSEILLSTVSSCLMNVFHQTQKSGPCTIRLNFRSVSYEYLFGTKYKRNGVLGLKLPIQLPSQKQLKDIRDQIETTRNRQVVTYILSIVQINFDFLTTVLPSIWLKVIINLLSKKYSVTVTEVLGLSTNEPAEYVTRWNAEIEDVLFFRTPQANNSTSITVQRFRNQLRMNVMMDSNLGQIHRHISDHFVDAFRHIPVGKSLK